MTKRIKKIIFFIILIIFSVYLFLQFFVFFERPQIELYSYPQNTTAQSILLEGRAIQAKKFFIFGKEVFLDTNFGFQKEIFLFLGMNKINLKLHTKKDKIIEQNIQIFRTKKP